MNTTEVSGGGRSDQDGAVARMLMGAVRVYQKTLSPLTAPRCRFHPSCSQYTIEALATHGAVRGSWMGIKRIGRCQPFSAGGYDPVQLPTHSGAVRTGATEPQGSSS